MASAGEKALHAALKTRVFDPVYYLFGEDDFLKEQRDPRAGRRGRGSVDARLQSRDPPRRASSIAEALDALLSTPPMLAERRVVVLREVDKLKKGARTLLDRYLARPAPDTVLVLVAPSGAKADKALSDTRDGGGVRAAHRRPPATLGRVSRASTTLGRTITPEAVDAAHRSGGRRPGAARRGAGEARELFDRDDRRARGGGRRRRAARRIARRSARCRRREGRRGRARLDPDRAPAAEDERGVDRDGADGRRRWRSAIGEATLAAGTSPRGLFNELMALLKDTGAFPVSAVGRSGERVDEACTALDRRRDRCRAPCAARRRCGAQGNPTLLSRATAHDARARAVRLRRRAARPERRSLISRHDAPSRHLHGLRARRGREPRQLERRTERLSDAPVTRRRSIRSISARADWSAKATAPRGARSSTRCCAQPRRERRRTVTRCSGTAHSRRRRPTPSATTGA